MTEQLWMDSRMKTVICLDSYLDGIPKGWICTPDMEAEPFGSLSQLLIRMESLLNQSRQPQSYTATRSFRTVADAAESQASPFHIRRGAVATFEVRVIFRQHTSWQGVIIWLEEQIEHSFRSVLELILLMDSALRESKGCDSA